MSAYRSPPMQSNRYRLVPSVPELPDSDGKGFRGRNDGHGPVGRHELLHFSHVEVPVE